MRGAVSSAPADELPDLATTRALASRIARHDRSGDVTGTRDHLALCDHSGRVHDRGRRRWSVFPPGDLRDASASVIGRVDVQLTEIRGASQPLILQAAFAGPSYGNPGPLLGHVRRARLLTGSGEVLRDFAVEPGNTLLFILVQTEFVQDAAAFQALRSEFIAGRVSVELNTDLQGLEQLRVALPLKSAGNWERARCT